MHRMWLAAIGVAAVAAVVLGAATWAFWLHHQPNKEMSESRAPWLVLEPGTEVLLELSRPIEPSGYPPPWKHPDGSRFIPPPPPRDGKYWATSGLMTRWLGLGIVWVSKTHILYVAPDRPEAVDGLELYSAAPFSRFLQRPDEEGNLPAFNPKCEARLMIVTKGNPGLEAYGLTPSQARADHWWGEGLVRFKIVSMRSREEAGKDRGVPAGQGGKEVLHHPDGSTEEKPLYTDP